MPFRFDLVDLELFLNVIDGGSITAGAERSGLALAAASARVLAMEDSLGAPLLWRTQRGVEATPAGHALLLHSRQMLLGLDRMQGALSDFSAGLRKSVNLLCNTVAMHEAIPALLAAYLSSRPDVNVLLHERADHEVVAALVEGSADVGIVGANADTLELESRRCMSDALVLVTPSDHPLVALAASGPVSLSAADDCDIVGLRKGTALQELWDRRVAQRARGLNYRVRVYGFDEQCRLVARGAGIALMPRGAALRHARSLPLGIVPLSDAFAHYSLRLCVRSLADLPSHARELVEILLGRAGDAAT